MADYKPRILPMLEVQPSVTTSTAVQLINEEERAYSAFVDGTGAVSATFIFECSNDGVHWNATPMATVTISGTNTAADGFTTIAPWPYVRVRLTAISGTGAFASANVAFVGE